MLHAAADKLRSRAAILLDEERPPFKGQLTAEHDESAANPSIAQTTDVKVKPGIYQVRVAARDLKTGLVDSTFRRVTVPDLTTQRVNLVVD